MLLLLCTNLLVYRGPNAVLFIKLIRDHQRYLVHFVLDPLLRCNAQDDVLQIQYGDVVYSVIWRRHVLLVIRLLVYFHSCGSNLLLRLPGIKHMTNNNLFIKLQEFQTQLCSLAILYDSVILVLFCKVCSRTILKCQNNPLRWIRK